MAEARGELERDGFRLDHSIDEDLEYSPSDFDPSFGERGHVEQKSLPQHSLETATGEASRTLRALRSEFRHTKWLATVGWFALATVAATLVAINIFL